MASPTMDDFATTIPNFVLKLKLVSDKGPERMHRIRLHRILLEDGSISLEALVNIVVRYTKTLNHTFTYTDVDGDCVVIACTDELIDAVEQYAATGMLRITVNASDQEDLLTVLEVAAHTLTTSVQELCKEVPVVSTHPSRKDDVPEEKPCAVISKTTTVDPEPAKKTTETAAIRPSSMGKLRSSSSENAQTVVPVMETAPTQLPPSRPSLQQQQKREFIHFNHTCDICLCCPIVGTRWHAVNRHDYDLCQNCKNKYAGNHLRLEPQQRDYDRLFQDQWHERLANANKQRKRNTVSSVGVTQNEWMS